MLPKASAIEHAIRGGVRRVHVISYKSPDSLLAEIFTNEGTGTLVVADLNALSPAEQNRSGLSHDSPLGQGRLRSTRACLNYTAGDDHLLDNRLVRVRHPRLDRACAKCCDAQNLLSAPDLERHSSALDRDRRGARTRRVAHSRSSRKIARPRSRTCSPRASARPAAGCMRAARATIRCSRRCGCTCATPRMHLEHGALAVADALRCVWRHAMARSSCPATPTCSRPCRAAWRCGPAALPRRFATMRQGCCRRSAASARTRLGSAAGFGTPNLDIDREATRRRLDFSGDPRAGHRGAAVARQGRSAAAVRNHAAHAGYGAAGRRPGAVLHARSSAS